MTNLKRTISFTLAIFLVLFFHFVPMIPFKATEKKEKKEQEVFAISKQIADKKIADEIMIGSVRKQKN